jgi:hypothetical protein
VYADSIERIDEGTDDWVTVADSRGKVVGRGWLSPQSTIRVRIVDRGEEGPSEGDLLASRLQAAVALRRRLFLDPARTDAYRLVHAEGDGLPGLVVDRFGPVLVAQFATRPLHARRAALAGTLLAASGARSLVSRPGGKEEEEGIASDEVAFVAGDPAPERVEIVEEVCGSPSTCAVPEDGPLRRPARTGTWPRPPRAPACSTCTRAPAGSASAPSRARRTPSPSTRAVPASRAPARTRSATPWPRATTPSRPTLLDHLATLARATE